MYFGDAFSDYEENLPRIIDVVKHTVKVRFDEFAPKIISEAQRLIERMHLHQSNNKDVNVTEEMIRFVSCTSARCFMGMELSDEFYCELMKFTHFLNRIVILTYFLPKWLLKFLMNPTLRAYRKRMLQFMDAEIQTYRNDPTKIDSAVFRGAVDYVDKKTGKPLTNKDIGEIVICLLYVSSENTALGLTATLVDLASHPMWWDAVKTASRTHLLNGDIKSLFSNPVIDATVMESARLNSHIFALERRPKDKLACLGPWYVGDADVIALCEPMMMVYEQSKFTEPTTYNPNRFLGDNPEPKTPQDVMTWGAGIHLCPGKDFAKYEIKTAMALITNNFATFTFNKKGQLDFFSPSAFAEREAKIILKSVNKDDVVNFIPAHTRYRIQEFSGEYGHIGWCLRDVLSYDEQLDMYTQLVKLSTGSTEQKELSQSNPNRAYPLLYYNLVYTTENNCVRPDNIFAWASKVWDLLKNRGTPIKTFDSVYAQLFSLESTMAPHKDEYVDWGLSLNLGSACEFQFGEHIITLHSGDVFVADFSQTTHAVIRVLPDTLPGWYTDDNVNTFGRHRCSVQIRDISQCQRSQLSSTAFKDMLARY